MRTNARQSIELGNIDHDNSPRHAEEQDTNGGPEDIYSNESNKEENTEIVGRSKEKEIYGSVKFASYLEKD